VRYRDVLQGVNTLAEDLRVGGRHAGGLTLGIELVQAVQAIGIVVGQGTQQDRVQHAEYGAVGADAECQNRDDNRGEARSAPQHAPGVA
jgi:hypothetical protein